MRACQPHKRRPVMIIGIGNDICNMTRIAKAYERHGARFCAKILTDEEQEEMKTLRSSINDRKKRIKRLKTEIKELKLL